MERFWLGLLCEELQYKIRLCRSDSANQPNDASMGGRGVDGCCERVKGLFEEGEGVGNVVHLMFSIVEVVGI